MRSKFTLTFLFILFVSAVSFAADATVAPNGDGQFKSIQDAIMAAPAGLPSGSRPWIIHVKPGIYKELIYVQREYFGYGTARWIKHFDARIF